MGVSFFLGPFDNKRCLGDSFACPGRPMDVRPGRAISPPFSALADITYRRVNFDAPATTLTARGTGSVGDVVGEGGAHHSPPPSPRACASRRGAVALEAETLGATALPFPHRLLKIQGTWERFSARVISPRLNECVLHIPRQGEKQGRHQEQAAPPAWGATS
jgi:hypothetical protein